MRLPVLVPIGAAVVVAAVVALVVLTGERGSRERADAGAGAPPSGSGPAADRGDARAAGVAEGETGEPVAAPQTDDLEIDRLLATFSSGISDCDRYVHAFAAVSRCPALADSPASRASYRQALVAMIGTFSELSQLDPRVQAGVLDGAAAGCRDALAAVQSTIEALGCGEKGDLDRDARPAEVEQRR